MTAVLDLRIPRAEALFVSQLPTGSQPNRMQLDTAIRDAVRGHGGVKGCAADMAAAFGDHPEIAAPRMRWCLAEVAAAWPARRPR